MAAVHQLTNTLSDVQITKSVHTEPRNNKRRQVNVLREFNNLRVAELVRCQGQPRWKVFITYIILRSMPYTDALNDKERVISEKTGA